MLNNFFQEHHHEYYSRARNCGRFPFMFVSCNNFNGCRVLIAVILSPAKLHVENSGVWFLPTVFLPKVPTLLCLFQMYTERSLK